MSLENRPGNCFQHIYFYGKAALFSGCWIYPFSGMFFVVSHPQLYRAILPVLINCLLLSSGITIVLFLFTYLPQVAFCAIFSGPILAWAAAAVMVLGEANALISFFSKTLLLGKAQSIVFDTVLLEQGHEILVSRGREVKHSQASKIKTVSIALLKPLTKFTSVNTILYVLSLPLNFIPGIGMALFLLYNGPKAGARFHNRYFQLKGLSPQEQKQFLQRERVGYLIFGVISLALNLIPFVGPVFTLTNTAGAALWASQLEKRRA